MGYTYIPDLTERFPEGFGGVDLTDSYFLDWKHRSPSNYDEWDLLDAAEFRYMDKDEE